MDGARSNEKQIDRRQHIEFQIFAEISIKKNTQIPHATTLYRKVHKLRETHSHSLTYAPHMHARLLVRSQQLSIGFSFLFRFYFSFFFTRFAFFPYFFLLILVSLALSFCTMRC